MLLCVCVVFKVSFIRPAKFLFWFSQKWGKTVSASDFLIAVPVSVCERDTFHLRSKHLTWTHISINKAVASVNALTSSHFNNTDAVLTS